MMRNIILLILSVHWSQGTSDVSQSPDVLMAVKGSSAQMNCTHKKDILHNQMYWYRQRQGQTMTLIVFTSTSSKPDYGDSDPNKFEVHKSVPENGSLTVKNAQPDDSAIYFCLVSKHSESNTEGRCTKTPCTHII
ncbi:hypothetical protein ABG768_010090 [Culter alburnus]|uniref:Ig-like domain-containing protein n=1 Tax=Culter alburnus TaxID=194366 RepID=A0AAW1ZEV2_CULAL